MLHRGGGHVRGHAHPHQVIHDEAVEETAEEVLGGNRQRRAQAEERVRGHAPGRKHGGDEREAIGGAGDVTIREPRALVSPGVEQPACLRGVHTVHRRVEARAERLDVLPLNDGEVADAGVLEGVPVVCRVQLASETR